MSCLKSALKKVFLGNDDPFAPPNEKNLNSKEREVLIATCAAVAIPIVITIVMALKY